MLEEGPGDDWFQDDLILLLAIVGTAAAVGFFWRAFNAKEPIVDLRAFSDRNFAAGCAFSLIMGVGLYGLTYLYPVYLARVRGYSALQIGETMFVTGLCMFFMAPVAGKLMRVLDPRVMLAMGFRRLRRRHLDRHRPDQGLGFLGAAAAADLPRRVA